VSPGSTTNAPSTWGLAATSAFAVPVGRGCTAYVTGTPATDSPSASTNGLTYGGTTTTSDVAPAATAVRAVRATSGSPPTGTSGFGRDAVSGSRASPSPAARSTVSIPRR